MLKWFYINNNMIELKKFCSLSLLMAIMLLSCKKSNDDAATSVNLPDEVTLAIGEETQLNLPEVPAEQQTWSSSDPTVASVSSTGLVSAYQAGQTAIKVTYKGSSATCKINVIIGNYQKSWKYDFGTKEGNLSLKSAAGILSDIAYPHVFLPAPTDGQIARIWTGNNNVEGFSLTTSATIGSGSRLLFKAPPTTSTSKFSILNIDGTNLFSLGFHLKLQSGDAGTYKFAIGRDVSAIDRTTTNGGTQFSNNINFSPTAALPTFLIMWWDITASGYQLSIQQKDKTLIPLDSGLNPGISFANDGEYAIQVYANNSNSTKKYTRNNTVYIISAGASHIWINNNLLFKAADDPNFITSELDGNATLNAFMFMGLSNTDNKAQVYLDDFIYANYIADINTLPVAE